MKSYLMFGILLTLLNKKRCTLKSLAEKFEVSTKTISRHAFSLSMAGVPIISISGNGGGLELANTFSLSQCFFTSEEQATLLALLKSNAPFLSKGMQEELLDKLQFCEETKKNHNLNISPNICVDMMPWYQNIKKDTRFQDLKRMCFLNNKIEITYQKQDGNTTKRIVEPHTIIFKEGAFYLYAFCELKQAFRLFKISRILTYKKISERFLRHPINFEQKPWNNSNFKNIEFKFKYKENVLPEIEEWLSDYSQDKANKTITTSQPFNSWLINKIISFEDNITIIYPNSLIEEIKTSCKKLLSQYA